MLNIVSIQVARQNLTQIGLPNRRAETNAPGEDGYIVVGVPDRDDDGCAEGSLPTVRVDRGDCQAILLPRRQAGEKRVGLRGSADDPRCLLVCRIVAHRDDVVRDVGSIRGPGQAYVTGRFPAGGRITNHRQTYSEEGLTQSRLWREGTICITIAANIADSTILTYPACFPDSVVGVIPDDDLCSTDYVEYFIRTARDDLSQFAPATAQKNINIRILNDMAMPTPPREEQKEIVRRVEALFKLADTIEQRVAAGKQRADKLTQSILAKAFCGELVSTEAELARREGRTYEPASALLERIKAEREAAGAEPKTRRPTVPGDRHAKG